MDLGPGKLYVDRGDGFRFMQDVSYFNVEPIMQPTLILFNGPPRSGKDTAADIVERTATGRVFKTKFANAVKLGAHRALGLEAPADAFEKSKDDPDRGFMGVSWRQLYIAFSEQFMKPLFGKTVFGRLLGQQIVEMYARDDLRGPIPSIITVSDSGFIEETEELLATQTYLGDDLFYPRDVILIRLHRSGCTFEGDSRGYISLRDAGWGNVREYDIINDGSTFDLEQRLSEVLTTEVMRPQLYQLQVQIPSVNGEPGWAVFRDEVTDMNDALAFLQAARQAAYQHRVTRIVRGREVVRVVWPEEPSVYEFGSTPVLLDRECLENLEPIA